MLFAALLYNSTTNTDTIFYRGDQSISFITKILSSILGKLFFIDIKINY